MKGSKLYHANARRREAEQQKIEKTASVNQYFDKWGRITSRLVVASVCSVVHSTYCYNSIPNFRFETWTTPEYYQQADEALAKVKQQKVRQTELDRRRIVLRQLLESEQNDLDQELKERTRTKGRNAVGTDTLRKINQNFQRTADDKRQADLESQLYRRWRHDARADAILHESKSDHEAMAKMNWLDRQVAAQVDRAAEQRMDEERSLRMREESRKHMELLADRRVRRDAEIGELKSFQEKHVHELKQRSSDTDALRANEQQLRKRLHALEEERTAFTAKLAQRQCNLRTATSTRRIKLVLRERSMAVCGSLAEDSAMLERLRIGAGSVVGGAAQISALRDIFETDLIAEKEKQVGVEAMYESEAKQLLNSREQHWSEEQTMRTRRLQRLLVELRDQVHETIAENVRKQRELIGIKETHLKAVQNTNQRLKDLMADQRADELSIDIGGSGDFTSGARTTKYEDESSRSSSSQSGSIAESLRSSSISSESSAPRFGRKKIAWT